MQRGVFYTPRPVVSYIVRSVDELLRTEFGLADGLADTTTWGEMARRHKDLKIPEGVSPDQDFVQILDPATGTGTFLVEVIDLIHKTLVAKWKAQGHGEKAIDALWNEYVPKHLLTRLHGYELLMAPYAIAHLKIGLKLYETGYRFGSDERVRVYLTNALEPASDKQLTLDFLPALAHEAEAVNAIKRNHRFTVVIGNPPYSILSANMAPHHRALVERYRFVSGERIRERGALQFEKNIQDDYVKFYALAEDALASSGFAILGYVSNGNFLDAATLRGLRASLCERFPVRQLTDLHGDGTGKSLGDADGKDENVFDILQGVAIGLFARCPNSAARSRRTDLGGSRDSKFKFLLRGAYGSHHSVPLTPAPPSYEFSVTSQPMAALWAQWHPLPTLFRRYSAGIITARDHVVISDDKSALIERIEKIRDSGLAGC
jgi:predicted helicase